MIRARFSFLNRQILFGFVLFVLLGITAQGQTFSQTDYSTLTDSVAIAKADLNHDGYPDLISVGGNVSVLLNRKDGTFGAPAVFSSGGSATRVQTGDFNGDRHIDLLVLLASGGTGSVAVLLGNGDGSFQAPRVASFQFPSVGNIGVGDFNGDGKLDAVVGWVDASLVNHISVLLGDGAGGFTQEVRSSGMGHVEEAGESDRFLIDIAVADFNRDGKADIAFAECCGGFDIEMGDVWVLLGTGDGHFTSGTEVLEGSTPRAILVDDINQDMKPDLLVPFSGCHTPCAGVLVLYGKGDGSFNRGASVPFDELEWGAPRSVALLDADSDGYNDVAVGVRATGDASPPHDAVLISFGKPDGTFSATQEIRTGTDADEKQVVDVIAGDWNRDGRWDLATANNGTDSSTVLLNTSGSTCSWPTANRTIHICQPTTAPTTSPVLLRANPRSDNAINAMKVYVDGVAKSGNNDDLLSARAIMTPGTHRVTVKAWDAIGSFSSTVNVTVSGDSGSCQPASTARAVTICTPKDNTWIKSPFRLTAVSRSDKPVTAMKAYLDGAVAFSTENFAIDTQLSAAPGSHKLVVKAWDSAGSFSKSITVKILGGNCVPSGAARDITICSPQNGKTYPGGNVVISAVATSPKGITNMKLFWQGQESFSTSDWWIELGASVPTGYNTYTFTATDADGTFSKQVKILASGMCGTPSGRVVVICSPQNGSTVGQNFTLAVAAGIDQSKGFSAMKIYRDGVLEFQTDSPYFDIATGATPGTHRVTARAWDGAGVAYSSTITFTVQ